MPRRNGHHSKIDRVREDEGIGVRGRQATIVICDDYDSELKRVALVRLFCFMALPAFHSYCLTRFKVKEQITS